MRVPLKMKPSTVDGLARQLRLAQMAARLAIRERDAIVGALRESQKKRREVMDMLNKALIAWRSRRGVTSQEFKEIRKYYDEVR